MEYFATWNNKNIKHKQISFIENLQQCHIDD